MKQGMIPVIKTKTGKNMIRALLLGGAALLLSACGGGDGGSSAQTSAPTSSKSVLIEAYGDSTAVGCTVQVGAPATSSCVAGYAVSTHNEPVTLQYLLQQQYGAAVSVQNMGVKGTTLADLLNGTNGITQTWQARMSASKAQIVTVNDGLNDAYVAGLTPDQFAAELDQIISIAKASGKTIVLETPNPMSSSSNHNQTLAALIVAELSTANKWNIAVIDQFGYLSTLPAWPSMLSDDLHPSDAGYELKGRYAYSVLSPTVEWYLAH